MPQNTVKAHRILHAIKFTTLRRELIMNALTSKNTSVETCIVIDCLGFGWDRVNCLLSSWYSAVFWI